MTTDKGLLVWLPFVSGLQNQGLTKITPASSPALATGGKLGNSCLSGSLTYSANSLATTFTGETFTVAFWIKLPATIAALSFIIQYTSAKTTDKSFHLNVRDNGGINFGFYSDDYNCALGLRAATWEHVVMIYDGAKKIVYKNGAYVGERSSGKLTVGTANLIFTLGSICIQDFRLYSYALSLLEIKELSRGKIGHWLGDGNGFHIPNILTYTPENFSHNAANGSYTNTTEGNTRKCTVTTTSTNWYYSYYDLGTAIIDALTANTKYTVSFSFKSDNIYDINMDIKCHEATYSLSSVSSVAYNASMVGKWKRLAITLTTNTLANRANSNKQVLYFRGFNKVGTYYIKDIMFLKGEADSCYTTSTSQAFLSDISGFGRHGQIVGNVTLAKDTPRYDKSLKYNGGNVVVTGLPTMSTYTISWWDKFPAGIGSLFDWRLGPVNTTMSSSSAGALINNNTCYFKIGGVNTGYLNYSNYDITANTWYHCCLVCDDSKSRLYINGILKWEANKGSIADFSLLILGGKIAAANDGYLYTGQHSDFRIYATALSADDVKELYSLGH